MNIDDAISFVEEQIGEFERLVYRFESVAIPRYEKDKEILEKMRDQSLKMIALKDRADRGEEVTQKDLRDVIPEQFR